MSLWMMPHLCTYANARRTSRMMMAIYFSSKRPASICLLAPTVHARQSTLPASECCLHDNSPWLSTISNRTDSCHSTALHSEHPRAWVEWEEISPSWCLRPHLQVKRLRRRRNNALRSVQVQNLDCNKLFGLFVNPAQGQRGRRAEGRGYPPFVDCREGPRSDFLEFLVRITFHLCYA